MVKERDIGSEKGSAYKRKTLCGFIGRELREGRDAAVLCPSYCCRDRPIDKVCIVNKIYSRLSLSYCRFVAKGL